jgi:preprotein translocase subunit SecA
VFARRVQDHLAEREVELASRKAELEEDEERLRRWSEHLGDREGEVEVGECRLEAVKRLAAQPAEARAKTGRNERCPCGSGLKYKHCHGLPGASGGPQK